MTTTPLLLKEPEKNKEIDSSLSMSILQKIQSGHVGQVPRWKFMLTEYGIWILWGFSILIGAIACSVTIFFITHAGLGMYEATHKSALDLFLNVLPLMWVVTFVLMALLAHYNLRHTKRGYRYAVWQVLFSSIIFSLAGGLVLHTVGVSFLVDDFMEHQVPIFPSLNRVESHLWQAPQDGRMVGMYAGDAPGDDIVFFTDNNGKKWQLDTSELNPIDLQNLLSGKQVHVIGIASSTSNDPYFYGCGVFPWNPNRNMNFGDILSERQSFLSRMERHEQDLLNAAFATDTDSRSILHPMCAQHSAVIRVHQEFGTLQQ